MSKSKKLPVEDVMPEEIEAREEKDPNAYYDAKLVSMEIGRALGLTDAQIEHALGIKLKSEHRRKK
ncbi:MAG: hypothetical protein U9N14_00415 [Pseudomonadota bacterium]|nr:hypothetical protein [Pseudomonadota bacterium]